MKYLFFSPYGKVNQESGLMFMFASYLHSYDHHAQQLLCDGACSACGRDGENGWKRTLNSCFQCTREQVGLGSWGGTSALPISHNVNSEESFGLLRTICRLDYEELRQFKVADVVVWDLAIESLRERLGVDVLNFANDKVRETVSSVMHSTALLLLAAQKVFLNEKPNAVFVAGERDSLSRAVLAAGAKLGVAAVIFNWNVTKRCIELKDLSCGALAESPLVIEDLSSIRADRGTWSSEVVGMLEQIATFLKIPLEPQFLKAAQ